MPTTTVTCGQVIPKHPDEVVRAVVDFSGLLRQGEVLTGTPTVTPDSGLSTASAAINTSVEYVNRKTVEAGHAVTFTISAGTDGTTYEIKVSCGTSASQTRVAKVVVPVTSD